MLFFFFNDPATPEIYTLALHDALPISEFAHAREWTLSQLALAWLLHQPAMVSPIIGATRPEQVRENAKASGDRKSTRLNSSHANISYAVFCLKKKNTTKLHSRPYTVFP